VLTLVCVCMCSVSWLLLVKLSVLANWLARKTPLRKPLRGKEIISIKSGRRAIMTLVWLCCFFVLLCVYLGHRPYTIYFILLCHDIACLCSKCRWTPINQPTFDMLVGWREGHLARKNLTLAMPKGCYLQYLWGMQPDLDSSSDDSLLTSRPLLRSAAISFVFPFSALTLLGGRQEGHPACRKVGYW